MMSYLGTNQQLKVLKIWALMVSTSCMYTIVSLQVLYLNIISFTGIRNTGMRHTHQGVPRIQYFRMHACVVSVPSSYTPVQWLKILFINVENDISLIRSRELEMTTRLRLCFNIQLHYLVSLPDPCDLDLRG